MSLFQNSVLNKYLKELPFDEVESAWEKFKTHFHNADIQENIRNSKEEQYQGEFLIDLFVKVFGYVKNPAPNFNLTTELKNVKDSKKADGAILKKGEAIGVIELKGTNTIDLAKIETQAFGYKNNHPKCVYIITSNFEKLRFYIDNAVEFEEFNLFKLDRKSFDVLWLCLSAENLLKDVPKKIKDESLSEGEIITKKLYRDYSNFRNEIFSDIVANNPNYDKLTLFQKTQKLLDRFLFILFAEDKSLLPPNSTEIIIKDWNDLKEKYDEYFPLYDRFKKYFGYLNEGYKGKKHDIFAYNGGLFLPDEILDNIEIGDELLSKHTKILSNYDFASEVSVNILGHIFEHSLTEIESIQAELVGEEIDKSKTKRKKDGVFYTPTYITKYIVDNTIGKLCIAKKDELEINEDDYEKLKGRQKKTIKKLRTKLDVYREWLVQLTICDPACGSGAFLNQALEFLIAEHRYIDELYTNLEGFSLPLTDLENAILENNLFGVDINEESVEIAKLSLWLRTAQKGRKLTTLNDNIKCGNSLTDDPEIAGEKAFVWKDEFPKVFANGGFDVVIGNPPYGADFTQKEKEHLKEKFDNSTTGKVDSYRIFIEQSFSLTKNMGLVSFIIPNTFLYNVQSYDLRKHILEKVKIYDALELRKNIFEDAPDVVPSIMSFQVGHSKSYSFQARVAYHNIQYQDIDNSKWEIDQIIPLDFLLNDKNLKINLRSNVDFEKINKKLSKNSRLGEFFNLRQGTKPYGRKSDKEIELISETQKNDNWEKAINGRNLSRYYIEYENEFVHRCENLHSVIDKEIIDGEKIYFQRMRKISLFPRLVACYDNEGFHGLYTCSVITKKPNTQINLKFLLGLINSKFINLWFKYFDTDIEIKLISVKQIPLPKTTHNEELEVYSDKMLTLNKNFYDKENNFLKYLQSQFPIEKFSKKLQNWHELEFGDFINELNKAINKTDGRKLTKSDEMEWMELFKTKKESAQAIKSEIDKTDGEIDQMVYELYGLTDDEIAIVEKGVG